MDDLANEEFMQELSELYRSKSDADPDGSYTGTSADGGEPVQDADDL
ncbi:MAG: hypothetical protein LBP26_02225 [Clostridiales bacterium]|jgi:hypothetical protein|nr:hypothetical protein [Clostridiales bacterium]